MRSLCAAFDALGDPTRLEIVGRLAREGAKTTLDLLAGLPMSRQAATRHLIVLEAAGIVVSKKRGREIVRLLDSAVLDDAASWLARQAMAWDDLASPVDTFVGEGE